MTCAHGYKLLELASQLPDTKVNADSQIDTACAIHIRPTDSTFLRGSFSASATKRRTQTGADKNHEKFQISPGM